MTIKLKSPIPRPSPKASPGFDYRFTEAIFLPRAKSLQVRFDRVLAHRVSSRTFGGKLTPIEVGHLLNLAARRRDPLLDCRPDWQSRPYPSAGGCHEIDLLVLNIAGHEDAAFIYEPEYHALGALPKVDRGTVSELVRELSTVVLASQATVVWFVADVRRLAARYQNWETLLWRDSGGVGATLSLVATALGHASCLLGIHAPKSFPAIFPNQRFLVGAGGILVGKRT